MIEARRKGRRVIFTLGLLLVVGVVNGRASSSTAAPTSAKEEKAEARWEEEDPVTGKPGRSAGWKDSKDSYLEALRHSRTSTDPREGIVAVDGNAGGSIQRRKEYVQGPVYAPKRSDVSSRIVQHGSVDSFSMVPSDSYTLPSRTAVDFAGVRNTYGPPQTPRPVYGPAFNEYYSSGADHAGNAYLPPQQAYGPPSSSYGPPSSSYGPSLPYGYGASETTQLSLLPSIDFSWPFALKLNAFTLAKILLKLVIFKLIVKFIAIICLLLFIPKLEIKKGNKVNSNDEEDEGRGFIDANSSVWDRLNRLTVVVNEAVERHRASNEDCSSFGCLNGRGTTSNDRIWPDYEQLLSSYILEEMRSVRANT